ncbi:D-methionine-binding lipoprotein MetQ [termite gut metagenome]|uniref:D-methionine-binding lipoprotein MetQ n=1 Tax=termite gut metagenome TaxID=433724 RepID=A0A5J4R2I1_9ZZZZ
MNRKFFYASILSIAMMLVSCGNANKNHPNHIKVGVQAGPEYALAQTAQKLAKEKFELEVKLVQFNDYIMPNTALDQKDIDVNVFQTKPFFEEQVKQRGYKFVVVGNTFVYPIAGYSRKIKTLDELKDKSTIAIPNDISNGSRSLLLLEKAGLIKLRMRANNTPRIIDIEENIRNLRIIELEAPQLPRILDDANVDLAVINNNFATKAGLLLKDGIIKEEKDSPYVNVIVAREDNKDEEKVKKFVQAYQSEEVIKTAEREFKGGAVAGW